MLRLILIRHGQTQWNAQNRVMGRTDVPLNEIGQKQVVDATSILTSYQVDRILSSPQLRAMETVQPLSRIKDIPIEVEDRLAELRFDRWQGKVFDEIKDDPVYKERRQNFQMQPRDDVETVGELLLRTKDLLKDLSNQKGCIVCASHMDTLKAMVTHIVGKPVEEFFDFEIENATPEIYVLENGSWRKER